MDMFLIFLSNQHDWLKKCELMQHNDYKLEMLATRLQQSLVKRVEFIEGLILIHSYSEILHVRFQQYQLQNEQMYEKEMIMVETFRNIFRIDQAFRKFYYKICVNVFFRLNPKHKRSQPKNINRIHNVYFQFLLFFKGINELAIAKYLCDLKFETLSENELFIKLTHILIKYLKIKTQAIIQRVRQKHTKPKSIIKLERQESDEYKHHLYEDIQRKMQRQEHVQRKRFNNFLRKSSFTQNISKRKYNSQQNGKKSIQPARKISNQLSNTSQWLNQSKDVDKGRGTSNIDWKIRIKKFQEHYSQEWAELYRLTGLQEEVEELKTKCKKSEESSKKQWINENYRSLIQEMMGRNQQALNSFVSFRGSPLRSPLP